MENASFSTETFGMPKEIRPGIEVLKEGELFLTSLPDGSIPPGDRSGLGLYYRDTRFLSCLDFQLNKTFPVFLSSINRDGHFAQIELTNKLLEENDCTVPAQAIHLRILRAIHGGLLQRLRLANFHSSQVDLLLEIKVGADFVDIFEVRGFERSRRGKLLAPRQGKSGLVFAYLGLDDSYRSTVVSFYPAPHGIRVHAGGLATVTYQVSLLPQRKCYIYLRIVPLIGNHVGMLPEAGPKRLVRC
ncbi:MAG: hypothetical protein K6T29_02070 [Peptococcaceae bacterium]|nr:hypothetical protein [Peptococcaceae bacterium]